jgi:hypothetical protein
LHGVFFRGIQAKICGWTGNHQSCYELHGVSAMVGKIKEDIPVDELDDEIEDDDLDDEDDVEDMDDDDNIGDISVEINVEELVAKLEATNRDDVARKREIRRRLEELEEMRRASKDLDNTFNFDLDDDL